MQPGLQNHAVQLVSIDPEKLKLLRAMVNPVADQMKKYFSWCSEIRFSTPSSGSSGYDSLTAVQEAMRRPEGVKLEFTAYPYSGINGVDFSIVVTLRGDAYAAKINRLDATGSAESNSDENTSNTDEDVPNNGANAHESEADAGVFVMDMDDTMAELEKYADDDETEYVPGADDGQDQHGVSESSGSGSSGPSETGEAPHTTLTQAAILRESALDVANLVGLNKYNPPRARRRRRRDQPHVPRQDAVACALRRARALVESTHLVRDKRHQFDEYKQAIGFHRPPMTQGWARKPARGDTFGETYTANYMDTIEELYEKGNVDKNVKVSPAQVFEQLKRIHPNCFRLPRAWALQNVFNGLGNKRKDGQKRRRKQLLPKDVLAVIDQLLVTNPNVKPKAALEEVEAQLGRQLETSLQAKVKSRVSALKTRRKNAASRLC